MWYKFQKQKMGQAEKSQVTCKYRADHRRMQHMTSLHTHSHGLLSAEQPEKTAVYGAFLCIFHFVLKQTPVKLCLKKTTTRAWGIAVLSIAKFLQPNLPNKSFADVCRVFRISVPRIPAIIIVNLQKA